MAVIKTWIQAPPDSTPINFEEVWHLDGSTHRGTAKRRLEKLFADLVKYELARPCELVEISTMVNIGSGAKRTVITYRMSLNVFKHYISSSQAERGNRTRAKLHQAEEELEQLKAAIRKTGEYNVNAITQLADILDDPALNNRLMLELMHRTQKLKLENQAQAQDIEVKTGIIKVQAETIEGYCPVFS